jgi:endonuclease YncB( thermonuclease family)
MNTISYMIGVAIIGFAATAHADLITGPVRAIDGDTIVLGKTHIRVLGIDAPEMKQTCIGSDGVTVYECGRDARATMLDIIHNDPVTCQSKKTDKYRRALAVCYTETVSDIGEEMVRRGWAVRYLARKGVYVSAQNEAKTAARGLWSGRFEMPANWRADHKKKK